MALRMGRMTVTSCLLRGRSQRKILRWQAQSRGSLLCEAWSKARSVRSTKRKTDEVGVVDTGEEV